MEDETRYECIYRLARNWAERTAEEIGYPLPRWDISYADAFLELKGCISEPITSDDVELCQNVAAGAWNRML